MISRKQKVMDVVGEFLTRPEFVEMLAGLLDRRLPFKVALHANGIALRGRQSCGIYNRALALHMSVTRAMTALAGDPAVQERLFGKIVLCSFQRRLHAAGVAIQA